MNEDKKAIEKVAKNIDYRAIQLDENKLYAWNYAYGNITCKACKITQ